jgi:hypothetical protein
MSLAEHDLEQALLDLGRHLEYPPTPDLALAVRRRLAERPARPTRFWESWLPLQRRLAVALVAVLVLIGAVLVVSPEARTAIAERLGLRGVEIRQVPAIPSVPATATPAAIARARLNLGQRLSLDEARGRVPFQVLEPASVGAPDEVYLLDKPVGGQVALVYYPRPDVPPANTTGVGLLLTEFQGNVPSTGVILLKGLPPGTRLEEVQVNGGQGFWIEGDPHIFGYQDARGQQQVESTRLAGNVLLWEQGSLTLRLESALSKDAALRIAASVR